jgi:hypothetical protein
VAIIAVEAEPVVAVEIDGVDEPVLGEGRRAARDDGEAREGPADADQRVTALTAVGQRELGLEPGGSRHCADRDRVGRGPGLIDLKLARRVAGDDLGGQGTAGRHEGGEQQAKQDGL